MQTCVARTVTETVTSTLSFALSITTLKPGSDAASASESASSQPSVTSFSVLFRACESLIPAPSSTAQRLPESGNADAGGFNRAWLDTQLGNSCWRYHRAHYQRMFSSIRTRLPDTGTEFKLTYG